jgi:hypothetical protein
MLSDAERIRICKIVKKGAKLLVGRDHSGRQKIKLVKGPFGLFVERFDCTEQDLNFIRNSLQQNGQSAA